MGVFKVEPAAFQTAKERFNFPALGIVIQGGLRGLGGDEDEIVILDPHPKDEDGHAPHPSGLRKKPRVANPAVLKKPIRRDFTAAAGIRDKRIAFDPNAKPNPLPLEKFDPVCPNKLAVCGKTANPLGAKRDQKMFEQANPFERIRIAPLIQQDPQKRNCDPLIGDR